MNHRRSKSGNHPTLKDRVWQAIIQNDLVPEGTGVLVGVSGGPDSMALLHLLHTLAAFPLRVAHLNHQLRPGDCDADEQLVRAFCQTHALAFVAHTVDVAAFARTHSLGLEEAGRVCRHQFFATCSRDWQAERDGVPAVRIALAHHLDDQAETVLLHMSRGCGLNGLSGMAVQTDPFIRPLLGIRRAEILAYLAENALAYRRDASNDDPFTLRNRLRLNLLPAWQDALGFDPAPGLARMADLVATDKDYLDQQADQTFASACLPPTAPNQVCLDRQIFLQAHPAIQNRLLRLSFRQVSGQHRDIEWRHLKLARDLILEKRAKGHLDWPQGVVLDLNGPSVCFSQTEKTHSDINSLHKVAFETRIHDDRLI